MEEGEHLIEIYIGSAIKIDVKIEEEEKTLLLRLFAGK